MSVTTTAAVAGAVAANSAANTHRDYKQKVEKCKLVIDDFDSDTANTQQMQQYAECAQVVYPESSENPEVTVGILLLTFIAVAFIVSRMYV